MFFQFFSVSQFSYAHAHALSHDCPSNDQAQLTKKQYHAPRNLTLMLNTSYA